MSYKQSFQGELAAATGGRQHCGELGTVLLGG